MAIKRLSALLDRNSELALKLGLSFVFRLAGAAAAFFSSLVVSRSLGATESGPYFLAFAVVTFLAAFSRMGLDNTLLKHVGAAYSQANWGEISSVVSKSFSLAMALSCTVTLALFLLAEFIAVDVLDQPALVAVLRAISPAVLSISIFTLAATVLQGMGRIVLSVISLNIGINLGLIVFLLVDSASSPAEVAHYFTWSSYGTAFLSLVFLYTSSRKGGLNPVALKTILKSCLPLWVVVLMQQLTLWSGQVVAAPWVEPADIAKLAVAQRTAMLTSFILMAVNFVVAPKFAAMYRENDMLGLEKLARFSVKIIALSSFPVLVVCILMPGTILAIFGEDFREGGALLSILAVGQFVNVVTGSVGYLLVMSGHEKEFRNTVLVSGLCAVLLPFILVPQFGILGSALGTAFAVAIQNLGAVYWVRKRLGFNTLAFWTKL